MNVLRDPSTVPHPGYFSVTHPVTGVHFNHHNSNMVVYNYRKHCTDNNLPVPDPVDIIEILCSQHPENCVDSKTRLGLGDLVYAVAHPFAKGIDAAFGTDLANCKTCAERRALWNKHYHL